MNDDNFKPQFERELRSQSWRNVPSQWRREILESAFNHAADSRSSPTDDPVVWWRKWLWPHPLAWSGMAALWMVIAGLHLASSDQQATVMVLGSSGQNDASKSAVRVAIAEQQKLKEELLGRTSFEAWPKDKWTNPIEPADEPRPRSSTVSTFAHA